MGGGGGVGRVWLVFCGVFVLGVFLVFSSSASVGKIYERAERINEGNSVKKTKAKRIGGTRMSKAGTEELSLPSVRIKVGGGIGEVMVNETK